MSHSSWPSRARAMAALFVAFAALSFGAPAAFAAGGADDHSGHGGMASPLPADADRCDLGFNSKVYNDLIRSGKQPTSAWNFRQNFMAPISGWDLLQLNQSNIRRLTLGWYISQHMLDGRVAAGHGSHPLADPWKGLTDPVVCDKLKGELQATRDYTMKYPTLADATKAGFTFITPWFAGAGAHLGRWSELDDKIEPGKPEVLIYDGNSSHSKVVGAMYTILNDTEPKGVFAGGNDTWHQHKGLCFTENQEVITKFGFQPATKIVLGSEVASKDWCEGTVKGYVEPFESLWMMHTWVVPGCESKYGVFSHDLPYLTVRNYVLDWNKPSKRGCGTGLTVDKPLRMETNELNVPGKLTNYRSSQLSWAEAGSTTVSGPVAADVADHPGAAHADGVSHLVGTLKTEDGFAGPAGAYPVSILRQGDVIYGTVTSPTGTVATFNGATAERTEKGVKMTAAATVPGGAAVQLSIEFANSGLRNWFLGGERFAIKHPAHGHDHASGKAKYALASHPGENHVGEEHLFGTITTGEGFTGDAGVWTLSFTKNAATKAINGYVKSPGDLKRFNFTALAHHPSEECSGGVHIEAAGSEQATPSDPQNPEFVICDPAAMAFFADHAHGEPGTTPTVPGTTPGHQH